MAFNLFNMNKDGKGVEKNEDKTPNVRYYFKSLWRKFPKLITINLLMFLQFLPLILLFLTYFWSETVPTFIDPSFPIYHGISQFENANFSTILLLFTSSIQLKFPAPSAFTIIMMVFWFLLFAVTFGWGNVTFTYYMRELVRGNPIFLFADMKYVVKKNFKQGFLVGLADASLLAILLFNIYNMQANTDVFGTVMYFANLGILILYSVMRFYMYLMLITFDIKFSKMIKNALIFVVLGLKRNVLAILWILVPVGLNIFLLIMFPPVGIAIPILYLFALPLFTVTYAAYPVIEKYMITPYQHEEAEEEL